MTIYSCYCISGQKFAYHIFGKGETRISWTWARPWIWFQCGLRIMWHTPCLNMECPCVCLAWLRSSGMMELLWMLCGLGQVNIKRNRVNLNCLLHSGRRALVVHGQGTNFLCLWSQLNLVYIFQHAFPFLHSWQKFKLPIYTGTACQINYSNSWVMQV